MEWKVQKGHEFYPVQPVRQVACVEASLKIQYIKFYSFDYCKTFVLLQVFYKLEIYNWCLDDVFHRQNDFSWERWWTTLFLRSQYFVIITFPKPFILMNSLAAGSIEKFVVLHTSGFWKQYSSHSTAFLHLCPKWLHAWPKRNVAKMCNIKVPSVASQSSTCGRCLYICAPEIYDA